MKAASKSLGTVPNYGAISFYNTAVLGTDHVEEEMNAKDAQLVNVIAIPARPDVVMV
jgi:hypothetical protein